MSTFAKHVLGAVKIQTSQTFVQFVIAKSPCYSSNGGQTREMVNEWNLKSEWLDKT